MIDWMTCPHCGHEQDQTEPREWHSLGHSDYLDTECDNCEKPIRIEANIHFNVTEVEDA